MKQVTIPAQWLQELIALCGPEDHELRERVMKSAAPAPVDALATGGQAQAVASIYVTEDGQREVDDWRAPLPVGRNLLYAAPQPQADARDAERWVSESVTGTPFLQDGDQHLLDRFIETTEDNEGFDIGKEAIKRLANLGVVESLGFGRYGVTMFGYWVHEHYWHQNPSLPLKTNADRDADARAAIAKATGAASSAAQPVKENT